MMLDCRALLVTNALTHLIMYMFKGGLNHQTPSHAL